MCTCRVMVCIITLCAHAEWQCVSLHYMRTQSNGVYHTLCAHAGQQCVSLHYMHMQSDAVHHYTVRTCRVMVCIITLCAHAEWQCVSLHFVHMQSDSVYHYIPSRLKWTNISLPPMSIRRKFYMKCMKSEHAAQKYAGNLHKIWKHILTMLCCEPTCKTDTCMHVNHMSKAKCKMEHLPAAGNSCILVQEESEK